MVLLIIGCGIDLVKIKKMEKIIKRWGESFTKKIFTSQERAYCENRNNKYQSYAARFAAKEAFLKALGLGMRGVSWKEIEVENNQLGQPTITTSGKLKPIISRDKVDKIYLTISHTKDYAIAEVILETLT
jgi:holo-[acyl-carrier protein] synthase